MAVIALHSLLTALVSSPLRAIGVQTLRSCVHCSSPNVEGPSLPHKADDRVAVFGGSPTRHRRHAERRLFPFSSLDMYGTSRDAGSGDAPKLISRIKAGRVDVVYCWTRFCEHSSFYSIRAACSQPGSGVKFFAVRSLNKLDPWTPQQVWRRPSDATSVSTSSEQAPAERGASEMDKDQAHGSREAESVVSKSDTLALRRAVLEELESAGEWTAMLQEVCRRVRVRVRVRVQEVCRRVRSARSMALAAEAR